MAVDGYDTCIRALISARELPARAFFGRKTLREKATGWYEEAAGFPTLLGARVRPLAHQVYAALRILQDRTQRFLLADEVGLGKTIEAGLVLQALWHHSPELSVLVITPGSMVGQWWRELYLRFGARVFTFLDATVTSSAQVERRLDSPRLVVSTTSLQRNPDLRRRIAERHWEALVVDEGHHLDLSHPLYGTVRELSSRAEVALILSATPSQRKLVGLAALLALVAPREYQPDDVEALAQRINARREIWRIIDQAGQLLEAAEPELETLTSDDVRYLVEVWGDALRVDRNIDQWLNEAVKLEPRKAHARLQMALAYARERWRLDHRILRTRRRTLHFLQEPFSKRRLEAELAYEPSGGELTVAELLRDLPPQSKPDGFAWVQVLNRIAASTAEQYAALLRSRMAAYERGLSVGDSGFAAAWESQSSPAEEAALVQEAPWRCPALRVDGVGGELGWLRRALAATEAWKDVEGEMPARFRAALQWLAERSAESPQRRFLVFSQELRTVEQFASVLKRETSLGARTFHHGMEEDALEKAALAFIHDKDVRVLVSDDLGGEGRNFQNAWAVLHLDVPVSPGRLEQRIGRVDRLGRSATEPVRSATVTGPFAMESFLHRAHRDVFRVFEESIGGLEFVVPELVRQLRTGVAQPASAEETLSRLAAEVRAAREEDDQAFQAGLDTSRAELKDAAEIAELLAEDPALDSAKAPVHWMTSIGVGVEQDGRARSRVSLNPEHLEVPIPGVGNQLPEFRATWRRADALEDEGVQFLAPGHRLVDGAYLLLDGHDFGRAAFMSRLLGPANRNVLFALGLFVVDLPEGGAGLPVGLVARTRARVGRDTRLIILRYQPDIESWTRVGEQRLVRELERPFEHRGGDRDLSEEKARLMADGRVLRSLEVAFGRVVEDLRKAEGGLAEDYAEELARSWAQEMAYLHALLEAGTPVEQERARAELQLRQAVITGVRELRPRLDALALVMGS
ncbi:SNF2-related protein [Cystobacter fuscus]|uniref:SNF2-related protein n=1 Tax=Cystobacter fuscus TaxID=43 RepID=UPI0037C1197A